MNGEVRSDGTLGVQSADSQITVWIIVCQVRKKGILIEEQTSTRGSLFLPIAQIMATLLDGIEADTSARCTVGARGFGRRGVRMGAGGAHLRGSGDAVLPSRRDRSAGE